MFYSILWCKRRAPVYEAKVKNIFWPPGGNEDDPTLIGVRVDGAAAALSTTRAQHTPGWPAIDGTDIRMLIIGYVFAIRSERALCLDVMLE